MATINVRLTDRIRIADGNAYLAIDVREVVRLIVEKQRRERELERLAEEPTVEYSDALRHANKVKGHRQ